MTVLHIIVINDIVCFCLARVTKCSNTSSTVYSELTQPAVCYWVYA